MAVLVALRGGGIRLTKKESHLLEVGYMRKYVL
jgi:hypothetical protein